MTGRDLHKEWIGKNFLSPIPPKVMLRVLNEQRPSATDLPICPECGQPIRFDVTPEFDHRVPLADGGEHRESNLRALHPRCHKRKTATEAHQRAETRSAHLGFYGLKKKGSRPMPGSKASGLRKRMDGTVEHRNPIRSERIP